VILCSNHIIGLLGSRLLTLPWLAHLHYTTEMGGIRKIDSETGSED